MDKELFERVRRKLNVTWQDEETDARITEIIESTIPYLKHKLGIVDPDFDFNTPGIERTLFLNRCLYEWNHVSEEFEGNYSTMIADAQAKHAVEAYKSEMAEREEVAENETV